MPNDLFPIDYEHRLFGRMSTVAVADPSPRRLAKLQQGAESNQLRGVACGDLVLVFPAYEATHLAVRESLKMPAPYEKDGGCDFWVIRDGDEPSTGDWETSDDDLVRDGMRLILGRDSDLPALAKLKAWFADEPAAVPRP